MKANHIFIQLKIDIIFKTKDAKVDKLIENQKMMMGNESLNENSVETRLQDICIHLNQFRTAINNQIGPNFSNV